MVANEAMKPYPVKAELDRIKLLWMIYNKFNLGCEYIQVLKSMNFVACPLPDPSTNLPQTSMTSESASCTTPLQTSPFAN